MTVIFIVIRSVPKDMQRKFCEHSARSFLLSKEERSSRVFAVCGELASFTSEKVKPTKTALAFGFARHLAGAPVSSDSFDSKR